MSSARTRNARRKLRRDKRLAAIVLEASGRAPRARQLKRLVRKLKRQTDKAMRSLLKNKVWAAFGQIDEAAQRMTMSVQVIAGLQQAALADSLDDEHQGVGDGEPAAGDPPGAEEQGAEGDGGA